MGKIDIFKNSRVLSINSLFLTMNILGQSGPGNNGNERILQTPQISRTKASPSDAV